MVQASATDEITRMDFYTAHLTEDAVHLPAEVGYIAADGYYAKVKFVTAVQQIDRHLISKFRCDANLRYLYTGPQKKKGARRKYDGKVKFDDLSRFEYLGEVEPDIHLYTVLVNSVRLKCNVRLVYVLNTRNKNKPRYALLFCTDTELEAETPFSMATQKIVYFNQHLLDCFISILALDPTLIKNTPIYQELATYGAISP